MNTIHFSGAPRPKGRCSLPSRKQCTFILRVKARGFLRGIKSARLLLLIFLLSMTVTSLSYAYPQGSPSYPINPTRVDHPIHFKDGSKEGTYAPNKAAVLNKIRSSDDVITVDINGSGQYLYIQDAIDVAGPDDMVLVYPGEYDEAINFSGKNITVASLFLITGNEDYINTTIISAENLPPSTVATFNSGETKEAKLVGFTLRGGYQTSQTVNHGGGIHCVNSSPTFSNLIITDNHVVKGGGGIYFNNAKPMIENVTISNNGATFGGAGIQCDNNSRLLIEDGAIANNQSIYSGGGIHSNDSTLILSNVAITGNRADINAGGIACTSSTLYGFNVTISDNTAQSSPAGGGILCYQSSVTLENSIISHNASEYLPGGGLRGLQSTIYLTNVTIADNTAPGNSDNGSGIYLDGSVNLNLTNCIIWNNSISESGNSNAAHSIFSDIEGGVGEPWFTGWAIDTDPLFVDPDNGNYHLLPVSPCINVGHPAWFYESYLDNDPDGTRNDMGAYGGPHARIQGFTSLVILSPLYNEVVAAPTIIWDAYGMAPTQTITIKVSHFTNVASIEKERKSFFARLSDFLVKPAYARELPGPGGSWVTAFQVTVPAGSGSYSFPSSWLSGNTHYKLEVYRTSSFLDTARDRIYFNTP